LSSADLAKVTASAEAMVYVSFFEGFGIPILEAFNSDIPVITSNVSSMPEVAKDAAILVDPFSVDAISQAMTEITKNQKLKIDLISKGRIRREDFSWQKSAEKLWDSLEKTMKL
jgi:glycosyltransferase involved in cell wall biosynthesis